MKIEDPVNVRGGELQACGMDPVTGALSNETGTVSLSWSANSEDLTVIWSEEGAPPVSKPSDSGSGLGIINTLLQTSDGSMETTWRTDGLRLKIVIPHE